MQKLVFSFLTLSFIIYGCSQINTESKEHYKQEKEMRHGMVPLPHSYRSAQEIINSLDMKSVKRGEIVYRQNCYICHGAKAQGDGPESISLDKRPENLANVAKKVPNFKFYMKISQWQGNMPGWKSALSDKDIEDIKSYILYLANK